MRTISVLLFLLPGCLLQGCNDEGAADDPSGGAALDPTYTWYGDVGPIVQARCVTCHQPGGIAPFSLVTYEDAYDAHLLMGPAVEDEYMPPLPANQDGCRPIDDFREMPDEEREVIATWTEEGAPEGDPADAGDGPEAPDPLLGDPTHVFDSGLDYLSDYAEVDDYRCFVVDPELAALTQAIAFWVESTNPAIVHHAIVYAAIPATADEVDALEAEDEAPGYQCFGGPGFDRAVPLAGYVPGSSPMPYPDDTGVYLPAATRFVVQMHYNFENGRESNRMSVAMWEPEGNIRGFPHGAVMGTADFYIPAGAADTEAVSETRIVSADDVPGFDEANEGRAWTVQGHMHQLGSSLRVDLQRADGSSECMLDIPTWNFHWQGSYRFEDPVDLRAGDRLRITCHWDNSDGKHAVTWGEGTSDEMCLANMLMTD